jgi:hypothetical protein
VLEKVLENPEIAKLPIVLKQQEKRAWLQRNLIIEILYESEIVVIGIRTDSKDASEKIVNAVLDEYLSYVDKVARDRDRNMLNELLAEKRKQQQSAAQMQDVIRAKSKEATDREGMGGSPALVELLLKELALADIQLTTMKAKRKAIEMQIERPNTVPVEWLIQSSPEYAKLAAQKDSLEHKREIIIGTTVASDDEPAIKAIDWQIEALNERIKKLTVVGADGNNAILVNFRRHEETKLYEMDQEIQVQQILVQELKEKCHKHYADNDRRTEITLDVSIQQTNLARANKIIDAIDDRILAIQTESKSPGRISVLSKATVTAVP